MLSSLVKRSRRKVAESYEKQVTTFYDLITLYVKYIKWFDSEKSFKESFTLSDIFLGT